MNTECLRPVEIVMAEDDSEDQMLVKEAFQEAQIANCLTFVNDGEELLTYLRNWRNQGEERRPLLLLLDLNMPKKDGREALRELKGDTVLRSIPVVILTTSAAEEDIVDSYNLGVSTYIRKPVTFDKFTDIIKTFGRYWLEIAEIPGRKE